MSRKHINALIIFVVFVSLDTFMMHSFFLSEKFSKNSKDFQQSVAFSFQDEEKNNISIRSEDDLCYPLPQKIPHVTTMWKQHMQSIFESLHHPHDRSWKLHDWNAMLLYRISPLHLMKSIKTLPSMDSIGRILQIVQHRRRYLLQNPLAKQRDQDAPPPLKVLVMGGSVTLGVACHVNPMRLFRGMSRKACSWSFRIEQFINKILGFHAVQVENIALGGTNTEIASLIYEFGLLPDHMIQPDIVINAYSTNDMHINTVNDVKAKRLNIDDALMTMIERFIRVVQQPPPTYLCNGKNSTQNHPPLLIFLDDYIGNEQHDIWETMLYSRALTQLAGYYNIMSVSYADVVRHFVYADTKETWFSPQWYDNKGNYVREIHPGMGAHTIMALVMAFNVFNAITIFCTHPVLVNPIEEKQTILTGKNIYKPENGLPELKFNEFYNNEPGIIPTALPPPLSQGMLLQNVSRLWQDAEDQKNKLCQQQQYSKTTVPEPKNRETYRPCAFAWIGNYKGIDDAEKLTAIMSPLLTSNNGWDAVSDYNKVGYAPTRGTNSSFTMQISNLVQPIRSVSLLVMKSYGELWAESRVCVSVIVTNQQQQQESHIEQIEIEGFHASNTSVSYPYKVKLDKAAFSGDTIKVTVKLIQGKTFKITGIALCENY